MSRPSSTSASGSNQASGAPPPEVLKISKLWDLYQAAQSNEQSVKSLDAFLRFCATVLRPDIKLQRFEKDHIIVRELASILFSRFQATLPAFLHGDNSSDACAAMYSWLTTIEIRLIIWVLEIFTQKVDIEDSLAQSLAPILASAVLCLISLSPDTIEKISFTYDASSTEQWSRLPALAPVEALFPTWQPLPSGLAFLTDPSAALPATVISTPGGTSNLKPPPSVPPTSPSQLPAMANQMSEPMSALIACHLLSLIGNLSRNPVVLASLAQPTSQASSFLVQLSTLFQLPPRAISYGTTTIQRHLVRALARLFGSGFYAADAISHQALQSCKIIPSLVDVLRSSSSLPNIICFEVCQLLVCLLRAAPGPVANVFMTDFFHADGYSAFVKTLSIVSKTASKDQQKILIASFVNLAFVERPADPLESLMYTVNFFNSFLCAVAEAKDMKPYFLRALGEIIVLHLDRSDELAELGIFKIIFSHFNGLSLQSRIYVLRLLKRVLSASSFSNFSLQDDEIKAYIGLLMHPTRRSSLFLVCIHMAKLMEQKKISRARLREMGLMEALFDFLDSPNSAPRVPPPLPVVEDANAVAEETLSEDEELHQCLELLTRFDRKAQLSAIAELSSSGSAASAPQAPTYLISCLSSLRGQTPANRVAYAIRLVALDLLRVYLQENSVGQDMFRERGGFQRLYCLLDDKFLRKPALDIVACIAIADILAPPIIIKQFLDLLDRPLNDNFEVGMSVRSEILSALRHMFMRSDGMKTAFRECGGMEWIVGAIRKLAADTPRTTELSEREELVISYILELLDILAWSWRGNAANLSYFRSKANLFASFRSALGGTALALDVSLHVRLADALLGMSLPAGWPPACQVHIALTANRFRASGAGSALSVARERSQTCHQCRDLLVVENPETLKLLIEFIVQREASTSTEAADSSLDTAFILTLKAVKFLVEITPLNAQILSSAGLVLYILENLRPVLLKDSSTSSRARSRQPLLLGLVERISQYSMSSLEFRKFMELLRSPTCPSNVLSTLCTISQRPLTPTFFVLFPKRKMGSIRIPDVAAPVRAPAGSSSSSNPSQVVSWPPKAGYSISIWFQVDSYGDSNTDRSVVMLFCTDAVYPLPSGGRTKFRIDAYLYKGILTVRSAMLEDASPSSSMDASNGSSGGLGAVTAHTFNEVFFEEKQWYHLVLSHHPSPAALAASKKAKAGEPASTKGDIEVWLDGKRCDNNTAGSMSTAPSSPSPRLLYPTPAVATSVQFTLGNTAGSSAFDDKGVSNASWSIGNVIMFDCFLEKDFEAYLLYCLGPNYVGGLDGLRGSAFFVYEAISPSFLSSVTSALEIMQQPGNFSLSHLHERILFFFTPRDRAYSRPPTTTGSTSKSSSLDKTTLVDSAAVVYGDFVPCQRVATKDIIISVGGVSSVLYLIASAHTEEYQRLSLNLLRFVLEWNAVNIQQMIQCGGYEILARILRRREWALSEAVLEAVFALAGLARSKKRGTFSDGLIKNVEAVHYILLDWKIWVRAPDSVKNLLFLSLAELASTSEHASFNVLQLRTVKIRTLLLMMLEEDEFPYSIAQHVVRLLSCLMHDPWNVADIKAIFRYVVATHGGPGSKFTCPHGVDRHKTVHFTGITSGSRPTLSRLKSSSTINLDEENDLSLSSSWNDLSDGDFSGSTERTSDSRKPVRDLLIAMLVDSLSKGAAGMRAQFFELCNLEVLFALLSTPFESSRSLILRLIEIFLRDSLSVLRFRRANGFVLLGDILRSYPISEEIVCVLICIMLGRTYSPGQTLASIISAPLTPAHPDGSFVLHPEIVTSTLLSITSCFIPTQLQHSTIKGLHDLFLQDASIKQTLIKAGIAQSLVNIIVIEWEHRVAKAYHQLSSLYSDRSVPISDIHAFLEDFVTEEIFDVEQDALHFLRATVLFGCTQPEQSGFWLFEEALTSLQLLPVPLSYVQKLQKRLIYDVLDFFLDNSRTPVSQTSDSLKALKATLSGNFTRVAVLCVNYWIVMLQDSKTEATEAPGSVLPRRPSFMSLPSPTKALSRSSSSALLSPGSPATTTGKFDRLSPRPNSTSLFHEILQAFDDEDSDASSSSLSTSSSSIPDAEPSKILDFTTESVDASTSSTNPRASATDSAVASDGISIHLSASDDILASFSKPAETTSPETATALLRDISSCLSSHGRSFLTDAKVFSMILDSILEYAQLRSQTSPFKRLKQALKRKTVGVSSMSDVETDLSWHLEKVIFHTLTELREHADESADVICLAMHRGADLSRDDLFFSETEYLARFLFYSYPYLQSLNEDICEAAWTVWRKLLLETPTKLISKIVDFIPNSQILNYKRGDESNFKFLAGISDSVTKVEMADSSLRRQWNSSFSTTIREALQLQTQKVALVKQVASACSTKIIEVQQIIIKPLIEFMRSSSDREKKIRAHWRNLIKRLTHERGIWPMHRTLIRWELDSTEGPTRVRSRLKPRRAHRHPILGSDTNPFFERYSRDPRTLYADFDSRKIEILKALESQLNGDDEQNPGATEMSSHEWVLPSGEKIISLWICAQITPFHKRDGELLLGEKNCFFVDTHRFQNAEEEKRKYTSVRKHRAWSYEDIREIHKRRYMLVDNALEIFLVNGKTFLFAFEKRKERDSVYEAFLKLELPNFVDFNEEVFVSGKWTKTSITEKWQKGIISNFEYLMYLNTLAGRSFNDLTQYPVFPFILRDYTSANLDLSNPESFRDLSKPMGAQDPKRLAKFIEKYQALVDMDEKPYFYGSHYSNVGTVLHFLVRLEPFSSFFIEFQGGRFDVPDRTFYSMAQTWDLSSSVSQSDVKELIPEFFFLPEFLRNTNRFHFGAKQDGVQVDDVFLPPWANGSARTFVLKHIEALESDYVSENLHQWIDLIFGQCQLGDAALKAYNLFHPYTYEGAVDIDKVTDQLERDAIITQINSYGQTPKQLFKKPHPQRSMKHVQASLQNSDIICAALNRLSIFQLPKAPSAPSKLYFSATGQHIPLYMNQEILWPEASHYLQWGHCEGSLVTAVSFRTSSIPFSLELFGRGQPLDTISCVSVSKTGRLIVAGSQSSIVRVWRKNPQVVAGATKKRSSQNPVAAPSESVDESQLPGAAYESAVPGTLKSEARQATEPQTTPRTSVSSPSTTVVINNSAGDSVAVDITFAAALDGHLGPVTTIAICPEQSIFATGSADKFAIIWDMNRLRFLRHLGPHYGPVTSLAIQPFWGEIVAIDLRETSDGSTIHLWSVNGDKLAEKICSNRIGAVAVTSATPGVYHNVVITGHDNGTVCMWRHMDLSLVHELTLPSRASVTALCVSDDNTRLLISDATGGIYCCATRLSLITGTD